LRQRKRPAVTSMEGSCTTRRANTRLRRESN
jgi:hypothetical protein